MMVLSRKLFLHYEKSTVYCIQLLRVFLPDTIQLLTNIRIVHSAKELYL